MININPNIDGSMFTLKHKECFDYPICKISSLPTLNDISIQSIYLDLDETKRIENGEVSFAPRFSGYYTLIRFLEEENKNNKLTINKDFYKFFGNHIFNNEQIFVTSICFSTDTTGRSGPGYAIKVCGYNSNGSSHWECLYPYKNDISNIEYWNNLISFFNSKELIDGDLKYNVINKNNKPELELKVLKTIRKFKL